MDLIVLGDCNPDVLVLGGDAGASTAATASTSIAPAIRTATSGTLTLLLATLRSPSAVAAVAC